MVIFFIGKCVSDVDILLSGCDAASLILRVIVFSIAMVCLFSKFKNKWRPTVVIQDT